MIPNADWSNFEHQYKNCTIKFLCDQCLILMSVIPIIPLIPIFRAMVYLIQHYVIKFVSDFRQVCGFLRVLKFPPLIKLTTTI
jgi:uncharacterized membrane protein YjjP (DUF1212 family)